MAAEFKGIFYDLCNVTSVTVQAFVKAYRIHKNIFTPYDDEHKGVPVYGAKYNNIDDCQMNVMTNYFIWNFSAAARKEEFISYRQNLGDVVFANKQIDHDLSGTSVDDGFLYIL